MLVEGGNTESNTTNQETTSIGPNGGTVASSDGKAKVVIPAGALTSAANITVATVSNQPSGNIGIAFEIGPDGTTFNQPVTISVTYDESSLPSGVKESDLKLGTVTNNQWEALSNSTVDTTANVISGTTSHLSIYGILAVSSSGTVPSSPTGVTAKAADGQATIAWDPVSGATSYNLYMASQSGVTKSNYSTLSNGMLHSNVSSPFIHTGLTNGTTYYFIVTAVNASGESAESSEVLTTPAISIIIPNAPGSLQTTAASSTQINLSWTDNSADEDGFKIERKTGASGIYSQIATVVKDIKNYSDTSGLTANTAYCYQVRAFNTAGDSGYSNESCTSTLSTATAPPAPTGVAATPGNGQVTITWNPVSGANSYNIYMASQSGVTKGNYSTLTGGMKHTSVTSPFVHTGLTNGTTYYIVITAVNANGESVESTQVVGVPTITMAYLGTFAITGKMSSVRYDHTATLLPNGKVLIAGGDSAGFGRFVARGELFNPDTNTFTSTGSMNVPRRGHTATLLPNGKVLIVGGENNSTTALKTAELYDPSTGAFTSSGSMSIGRLYHTATLLPNGKVLIAGGWDASVYALSTAELYDPSSGAFTSTGSMNSSRRDHTATLLSSGKVLIAGGMNASYNALNIAELYDPVTGTFTNTTGNMIAPHGRWNRGTTANLLNNGNVLIAGGPTELYDPNIDLFASTQGSMVVVDRIGNHTATLLSNGKVLITGGQSGCCTLRDAELYDPYTGTFTSTGRMSIVRWLHTATLLPNGKVLIVGGRADSVIYDSAELFY